jgi:uncharacterized protein
MLLGILSETHDELARIRLAIELLREAGAEALIHCGDLASPPIVTACAALPCWFVFGNHDADNVPTLQQAALEAGAVCLGWAGEVMFNDCRIAVAHGHMRDDIRWALTAQPDYLLSGHSHIASDSHVGLVRRIYPGALHEAEQFTVALLDLCTDELRFLILPTSGVC